MPIQPQSGLLTLLALSQLISHRGIWRDLIYSYWYTIRLQIPKYVYIEICVSYDHLWDQKGGGPFEHVVFLHRFNSIGSIPSHWVVCRGSRSLLHVGQAS